MALVFFVRLNCCSNISMSKERQILIEIEWPKKKKITLKILFNTNVQVTVPILLLQSQFNLS